MHCHPNVYCRRLAVFSFAKTLHATGLKFGCIGTPPGVTSEFRKVHQFNVFSVNTPVQRSVAEYFQTPEEYLQLNAFFQKKRDLFLSAIEGSAFRPIHSEGTYFQLLDYSAISGESDADFVKRLTIEHGVAAIPVSAFTSIGKDDKIIRL